MKNSRQQLRILVYTCLSIILASFIIMLLFALDHAHATVPIIACGMGISCSLAMVAFVVRVKRERNNMEVEVMENTARYHAIIAASNTGAWEYHADTQYQWCSPEYFQMLGYDAQEFWKNNRLNIEDIWMRLIHPDDRQSAIESFANYVAKKSTKMDEASFRMKHKNGEWRWIWSRGRTLIKADGALSSVTLGIQSDITERKNMEIDLAFAC